MQCKYAITALALTACLPVMAEGHLYLVGPGTPTGWSFDNPVELKETAENSNTWLTVCYLDNKDGSSFRLQPNRLFDGQYYGTETPDTPIGNDESRELASGVESCFKVATPGVYYIEANLNSNTVRISRMNSMYLIGALSGDVWQLNMNHPLNNTPEFPDIYWGMANFVDGDFKIAVDPANGSWDSNYFLFKGDDGKLSFKTGDPDDTKWTIGDPTYDQEQETWVEKDLVAGTYNIMVDAATKAVRFYMHAARTHLIGPAVSSWDYDDRYPRLESTGEGKFIGRHVMFRADELFKVVVDGKYYGSDSWEQATLSDNTTAFLRAIGEGADFKVDRSGFREVTVGPSDAGDGSLYFHISGLQGVWFDGICSLDYDATTDSYINRSGLNWLSAGLSSEVNIDGDVVTTLTAGQTGWYRASVTFDGSIPSYNLDRLVPSVEGDALGENIFFEEYEAGNGKFIRRRVYMTGGNTVRGRIGDMVSEEVTTGESGFYTVTLSLDGDGKPQLSLDGPFEAYMPLTEEDFNDGQKHYFLVGQRMGAWRLQPEWEFISRGDGSFSIPSRLLYNGYVMVAEVDNYEDYLTQTYCGYSHTDTGAVSVIDPRNDNQDITRELPLALLPSTGKNGCPDGKYTDTRYNDIDRTSPDVQHGSWEAMKTRLIHILNPDGYNDVEHIQSLPSRVNEIILYVDGNGHPSSVRFDGLNTSSHEVAKLRTFTLVGGGIRNCDVVYDKDGVTSPLNHQEGYNGAEWSEAWIQYDKSARPYVDGNGEYIYQTSFTRNWLDAHPSYFNFGEDFQYTSANITFNYAPDLTHDDQFGQRKVTTGNDFTRDEVLYTYFRDPVGSEIIGRNERTVQNLNDMLTVPAAERACFVVEDMWMEGMFKVWCGWGGSATNYEFENNGTNYTRWYRSNAGHGRIGEDCTAFYSAGQIMAFTLFEDMSAANFGVGFGIPSTVDNPNPKVDENGVIRDEYKNQPERRFFKRVEIWFNLNNGFAYKGEQGASVLIFYQEQGGPNISIAKVDESHISYNFNIPLIDNMPEETDQQEFGNVIKYSIYRIAIGDDGVEGEPVLVETVEKGEGSALGPDGTPRKDFGNVDVKDETTLPAGRYRYMIETTRANSPEVMTAKSNIVRLDPKPVQSGVENVGQDAASASGLNVTALPGEGVLKVRADGEIGLLTIYSVNGAVVNRLRIPANAASVDISALAAGVYIVNANNTSVRFVKR